MALFDSPLVHIYFQNKFMTYMGAGKPIMAAMAGEQADIITRVRCGSVVPTGDHAALAHEILEASQDPPRYEEMGLRGRRFVHDNLLLPDILERYADVVEEVAAGRGDEVPSWEPLR